MRLNPQHLLAVARRIPDSEYVVYGEQRLTRWQVLARVERLAAGLQALGVRPGDRVVTLLPPSPTAVVTLFLPWVLGSVDVPLNPLLRESELRHILADCEARVVIATARRYGQDIVALLTRLLPDLPTVQAVVIEGADGGDGRMFWSLDEVLTAGQPLRRVPLAPGEVGRIAYTSGTTGLPKGVVHSRDGYLGLARPGVLPRLSPRLLRCLLLPFPLCYYSGWLGVIAPFLAGGRVVLLDRFHPLQIFESIERERVSQLVASPTMYRLLLNATGQERYDCSSVRRVFFSTEPCSLDLARALHERFRCPLENAYGMNETGNITWTGMNDPWEVTATTVGRPSPGVRLRVVDDARQPLPHGEVGEILVQTTQMMRGYHRDPQATAEVLDEAGWFATGDIGYVDDDDRLRLVERKQDLIIRGGQNVYPAEVEQFLQRHPAVRRAGVVGVPAALGGEAVWAYLELYPGQALTPRDVLDFCRGQIAPFKIPQVIRFVPRLPVTVTDKVQRFRLREMALAEKQGGNDVGGLVV